MKLYDVKCPICGTVNRKLVLEETAGWMECEHCKETVKALQFISRTQVPVYTDKQLVALFGTAR